MGQATFNYEVLEKFECGLELQGSEVKSIRAGQVRAGKGLRGMSSHPAAMLPAMHSVLPTITTA